MKKKKRKKEKTIYDDKMLSIIEYVMLEPGLSARAKNLYSMMCAISREQKEYNYNMDASYIREYPGHKVLAKQLEVEPIMLGWYFKELEKKNFVEVIRRASGRSHQYCLLVIKDLE